MTTAQHHFETLQLHAGQEQPDPATDARAVPIYATTSYVFRDFDQAAARFALADAGNIYGDQAAARFALADAGNIYGRLTNTTQEVLEQRVAALEGGTAALAVASGAAAVEYALRNITQSGDHIVASRTIYGGTYKRVAALEGGTAALAVASGAAAVEYALRNITQSGDHIVASRTIYGGTYNLLRHTLPRDGIATTFVDIADHAALEAAITDRTRLVYFETFGNPNADLPDFEAIAAIAHRHGLPVIVDNTFATPYLFRPLEHGADIVVESATKFLGGHGTTLDNTFATPYLFRPLEHGADIVVESATKFLGGHGTTLGGVIVEGGRFDWAAGAGGFPTLTEPDPSYHGLRFFEALGPTAFVTRVRAVLLRDTGATISPFAAFLLLQGIRPRRAAARHRRDDLAVRRVPAAAGHRDAEPARGAARRQRPARHRIPAHRPRGRLDLAPLDRGARGPRTLPALLPERRLPDLHVRHPRRPGRGPRVHRRAELDAARAFIDGLSLFSLLANVADAKSLVIHPASTTHSQESEEELAAQGIGPGTIRLSIGLEHIDDILADLERGFAAVPASTTHSQESEEELAAQGIGPGTIRLSIGLEHIDDILADLERGFAAVRDLR